MGTLVTSCGRSQLGLETGPTGGASSKNTLDPECGNGVIDAGEGCDGADVGGATCESLALGSGVVSCSDTCAFDTSHCQREVPTCGDGAIGPGEACDGSDLGGATCDSLGLGSGVVRCSDSCVFDTARCQSSQPICGYGHIDPGEACDSFDVGGATCEALGVGAGPLYCDGSCEFDISQCDPDAPYCGNGVKDPGEPCDFYDVGDTTCESLGLGSGFVYCDGSCTLDTSQCNPSGSICGDGRIDPGEACDSFDIGGATCEAFGLGPGLVRCSPSCTFDTTRCDPNPGTCGNGQLEGDEECEARWLAGQTCRSLGFGSGLLECGDTCEFDTSGCGWCGNGVVEPGENCDGDDVQGESCTSLGLGTGPLSCSTTDCKLVTSGCTGGARCGNGVVEVGEQCDGADVAELTCSELGFATGVLACNSERCRLDVSGCVSAPARECIDACTEAKCGSAIEACIETEGCETVLDCLDGCREDPTPDCAINCVSDISAAAIAIIAADCVRDCATECSGG